MAVLTTCQISGMWINCIIQKRKKKVILVGSAQAEKTKVSL